VGLLFHGWDVSQGEMSLRTLYRSGHGGMQDNAIEHLSPHSSGSPDNVQTHCKLRPVQHLVTRVGLEREPPDAHGEASRNLGTSQSVAAPAEASAPAESREGITATRTSDSAEPVADGGVPVGLFGVVADHEPLRPSALVAFAGAAVGDRDLLDAQVLRGRCPHCWCYG